MRNLYVAFIKLFTPFWKGIGVDTKVLSALVEMKLLEDSRRPIRANAKNEGNKWYDGMGRSVFLTIQGLLMGTVYLTVFLFSEERSWQLGLWATFYGLLLLVTLLMGFVNQIIDTRDNNILLPKPIPAKTLLLSRVLRLLYFLLQTVLPVSLPLWVCLIYMEGWGALPPVLGLQLSIIITVLLGVHILYLGLIKWLGVKRFSSMLTTLQAVLSIGFFAIIYLQPRQGVSENLDLMFGSIEPYLKLIPGFWYGYAYEGHSWAVLLVVALPFLSLFGIIKFLTKDFIAQLSRFAEQDSNRRPQVSENTGSNTGRESLGKRLLRWIFRNPKERAFASMLWSYTFRTKAFRTQAITALGYVVVLSGAYLFRGNQDMQESARSFLSALILYIPLISINTFILLVKQSEHYKASWVFHMLPHLEPKSIMKVVFKSLWYFYLLPFSLVFTGILLYVNGWNGWMLLLSSVPSMYFMLMVLCYVYLNDMPLSVKPDLQKSGSNFISLILAISIPMVLALFQYLSLGNVYLIGIYVAMVMIAAYVFYGTLLNKKWPFFNH
jgi:ABC-2 type transport system permease protein